MGQPRGYHEQPDAETRELPAPPRSAANEQAREVLRAWHGPDGFEVMLRPFHLEPGAWGVALCDIARNIALAAPDEHRDAVLDDIRQLLDAEWAKPTDWPRNTLHS